MEKSVIIYRSEDGTIQLEDDIYIKISDNLKLDLEKHNSQYYPINIEIFNKSHDRFLQMKIINAPSIS